MDNSNITFRLAQFIDIDPLMELAQEFYQFYHIVFDDSVVKAFTALLSDENFGLIWLICDRDRPIGYVALTFFFSMEYHGRCGLVDELYQGMRSLSLVVDFWNDKAEALYTKIGFQREKRHLMIKHIS